MEIACDKETALKVSDLLKNEISKFELIGERIWGNPQGMTNPIKTYQLINNIGTVWCCPIDWSAGSHSEINRSGILVGYPSKSASETIGQVVEIVIPYYYSKRFNTRAYRYYNTIEIRNYGKFTIGRSGLKRRSFFDYLAKYEPNRIKIDEDNNKYINVLKINDYTIETETFKNQIIDYTLLVKNFKIDYTANKLNR